jgi:hypothetical protein
MKIQKFVNETDDKDLEMLDLSESHNQTMSHLVSETN